MANRNGLNHKIRGQKGVGFNRALPAAFGFDRSYKGNSTGYFNIPLLVGKPVPSQFTIEFWAKPLSNLTNFIGYFGILDTNGKSINIQSGGSNILQFLSPVGGGTYTSDLNLNSWNHIVCQMDLASNMYSTVTNGNISSPSAGPLNSNYSGIISNVFVNANVVLSKGNIPIDEFRFYNRLMSSLEIVTNYNSGLGNNPSITEGLQFWYKFENFETLDFSNLQNGSNLRLGIRDLSNSNNHALINGSMDTNTASQNYVLQPV